MLEIKKIEVTLDGLSDIMFDRFIDHSKEERPLEQKLYLAPGNKMVIPAENIMAFLFGERPGGCAKIFEGRQSRKYILVGQGHVAVSPILIPLLQNGKQVVFKNLDDDRFWINETGPRVKGSSSNISIKQELKRPVFKLPWEIGFQISLIENNLIDEIKLRNWFDTGGLMIALCNGRPRFGRFSVKKWKVE